MGYWGYKATESDGALDMLGNIADYLDTKWEELLGDSGKYGNNVNFDYHGDVMGIVTLLVESDNLDKINFTDLRSKAIFYLNSYIYALKNPDYYCEEKDEVIEYYKGLVKTLKAHIEATMCDAVTGEVFTSEINLAALKDTDTAGVL